MVEQPTSWAQFENANLTSTADVSVWHGLLGRRQLAPGVPACCGASAGSGGRTWADEGSGVNNAHWQAPGNRLIGLGLGGALPRIGREFNGNWYPWQVAEGGRRSYIAGYRHVVTVLRGLPGAAFQFCWSPTLGVGNLTTRGTESRYSGESYVDEIGVDVYDWTHANSAGAQIYPGKAADTTTGGGDNAVFVRAMADFICGCSPFGWHAMWEDPWGAGVCDPDTKPGRPIPAPMARAAFLQPSAPEPEATLTSRPPWPVPGRRQPDTADDSTAVTEDPASPATAIQPHLGRSSASHAAVP